MEKLIWLLNEFCREKRWDYVVVRYREKEHSFDTFVEWKVDYMTDLYVVSKRCWFIEWLVENDKLINFSKYDSLEDRYWCGFLEYENRIMLLSISDEPIALLISLLK